MKLTYLGTAAAEGWPAVFCECPNCKRARELGGKNVRTRSQALVDGELLIDFPVDTYYHSLSAGIELSKIEDVIVTHTHPDHFSPYDLAYKGEVYSARLEQKKITFHGNAAVKKRLGEIPYMIEENVGYEYLPPFVPTRIGNFEVTALKANHKRDEDAYVYLIVRDKKRLLYLHDTGYLYPQTIEYLEGLGISADLVSFDCTGCVKRWIKNHMGFYEAFALSRALELRGIIRPDTVKMVNHFSHNGAWDHETLCREADKLGFGVSYDNLTVEF
ncbi:MAG: hypothetical protein IJV00_02765 [Clostridia bacterium]|nr:hypothetical protein [Clostridia bacterium]